MDELVIGEFVLFESASCAHESLSCAGVGRGNSFRLGLEVKARLLDLFQTVFLVLEMRGRFISLNLFNACSDADHFSFKVHLILIHVLA